MEDMKVVLREAVALRLSAAPDSVAKAELIEELTENLYCRYADLTAAGVESNEARARAVDALGDTDELVAYLNSLEPDQSLPGPVAEEKDDSQLDELLHNVEEIIRGAVSKARSIWNEAKETVSESGIFDRSAPCDAEFEAVESTAAEEVSDTDNSRAGKGWKVTMGYDPSTGKVHAGTGSYENEKYTFDVGADDVKSVVKEAMEAAKKAVKDAGNYVRSIDLDIDLTRGGKEESAAVVPGEPVEAAQLKGIDVAVTGGDVIINMSGDPESDVLVGGDIDELEVHRTAGGVLMIRPVKTETSSFFFGRGIFGGGSGPDVTLTLPCRPWELMKIQTVGGDVTVSGSAAVEEIGVKTVSGDVRVFLPHCARAECRTTNGDVTWEGDASEFRVDSVSGDLRVTGSADKLNARTTSGDVELEGGLCAAAVKTVSGEIWLRDAVLPDRLEAVTVSGDVRIEIPDGEAFTANFRTTSGSFTSDFFTGAMGGRNCVFNYQGGGQRACSFSTVSGDVELRKYRNH